ncbi:Hypothetical Protein FCC1311_106342 [Hondaea fermentalgiana]|uniref:Uncharacterized protein n=1 Tax=Hondaea fermentalgiana TaxID=2315210 RepID=A0A2R5GU85_9STRA|nr:Hypothetical Protein FCC1311_106342 [Hondaea fermentalgiana]|eukprot:GBG34410.1 Hypothetical Protein FCC1311_106342 [Hondaea fermentalgiana]
MLGNLLKPKPANIAAWAVAGGAMYAWSQYDKQKATTFSENEVETWNEDVKAKHPKKKVAGDPKDLDEAPKATA